MNKILLTGGAGFAGSHIVERILRETDWRVISLDRLTYAGDLDRLAHLPKERIKVIHHDFRGPLEAPLLKEIGDVEYIVHNGAETHVKRSFNDPQIFLQSNVLGTFHILEAARKLNPQKFLYTSTDEVFGPSLPGQYFHEDDCLNPSNPYSATKAAGEMLVRAYCKSFQLPTLITRTMNMFGERQHPEKFVPMAVKRIMDGDTVSVHVAQNEEIGSRQWLHAGVQASAIIFLLTQGVTGGTYHIAGEEKTNLEIAQIIADILEVNLKTKSVNAFIEFPAHDLHYGIDGAKLLALGWQSPVDFMLSFSKTVRWMTEHPDWLEE